MLKLHKQSDLDSPNTWEPLEEKNKSLSLSLMLLTFIGLLIISVAVGSSCSLHLKTGVLAGHYYELDPHWYAMLIK